MSKDLKGIARITLLIASMSIMSCSTHRRAAFHVVPGAPDYLLRSPDLRNVPFPQVLRDYNDFQPGQDWVDLQPQMELRIENAYYDKGAPRSGLKGFLGTEVARYRVDTGGLRLVSVEPMKKLPVDDVPVQGLISKSMKQARNYRLYFEIFNPASHTRVSALLAAKSKEELKRLSARMDHPEIVCSPTSTNCTTFPEACSVSVEMKIVVNERPGFVVWGSLLNSVVGDHPHSLVLKRVSAGRLTPVEIDIGDPSALRLPLLPRDRITWK